MNSTVKFIVKHSEIPDATPLELLSGELAINTADKKIFIKLSDGTLRAIMPTTFKTVNGESLLNDVSVAGYSDLEQLANTSHTHPVTDFTQSTLFFMTPDTVRQLNANTQANAVNELAITELENNGLTALSDYKVKFDSSSVPYYLDSIFGLDQNNDDPNAAVPSFAKTQSGLLAAASIKGVTTTAAEFNYLNGTTVNVQDLLTQLKTAGNFVTPVQTYADLSGRTGANTDIIIVIADELNANATSIYTWEGDDTGTWVHLISFTGQSRDFKLNPIDLQTEATGKVSRELFPTQRADQISIFDVGGYISGENVESALAELALQVK